MPTSAVSTLAPNRNFEIRVKFPDNFPAANSAGADKHNSYRGAQQPKAPGSLGGIE